MTHVLEAVGIAKRFGAVTAADDINVRVSAGERVGLVGSNGAGKTTFVNMITGYLKPDQGRIALAGRDITQLGPREINHCGVARSFQIPQLFNELSVIENILVAQACRERRFGLLRRARDGEAVDHAEELLRRFRLHDQRRRRVAELPGGVRKLLDIAMALTARPRLLLLDEPTSAVAADEKFPMMDTIMSAIGEDPQIPVLFVEHDMEIVCRHASRVIAFYAGRVIADAPPDEALAQDDVRRHVTGELTAG